MTPRLSERASAGSASERGIALITSLLVLMLISALLVGFTTVIVSDQRYRIIDRDRGQAFYAAAAGIEKQTVDLGNLFLNNVSPTNAQVAALVASTAKPVITNVTFTGSAPTPLVASALSTYDCNNSDLIARTPTTVGTNGYTIMFCGLNATTNPTTLPAYNVVQTGTYAGLMALKTPYQMDVTAQTSTGGEAHLIRTMEAVSVPVFQFGIFSTVDLAFNSADNFSFGGRVHTNGNLFLSNGANNTLTLSDKVDAYGQVVRQVLSNGVAIASSNDTGTVNMTKGSGTYRALLASEGSVVSGPTSGANGSWTNISLSVYKGYIINKDTGAHQLHLPLVSAGGQDIQLVQRPSPGEVTTSFIYGERLFNKASIRVMLSDTSAEITNIPGIDNSVAPASLEAGNAYGTGVNTPIPIAQSPGLNSVAISSATGGTIKLGATVPPFFQVSSMSASSGGNNWTITGCTAKTTTTFKSCVVAQVPSGATSIPINATISSTYNGITVTTKTSATAAVGTVTVSVTSTANFSPQTFWVGDALVTCTGYDTSVAPKTFTGCSSNPSSGTITSFGVSPLGTSLIGGYIKIERQNAADSTWHDITAEILGYGIGAPSQSWTTGAPNPCDIAADDPSPNAIIRLQRLRDSASGCTSITPAGQFDYWPNTLYDFREAYQRDAAPAGGNIKLGGLMHYVEIDAANLAKWFSGTAPYTVASGATGTLSKIDNTGYSIYISDRRNNTNTLSQETAEWGWEDFVNPLSSTATPNGLLDTGEDVNQNGTLDVYGGVPSCNGTYNSIGPAGVPLITCANTFFTTAFTPNSDLVIGGETFNGVGRAMVNRAIMFRRAVKLIHGSSIGQWVTGFTVVTENPVYMQGDWNCSTTVPFAACTTFANPHAATSVDADAVTLLSNNWNDAESFTTPYSSATRPRDPSSYYRMAVLAGKGPIFPQPTGTGATFGTDGGAHSFLRFLEGLTNNSDTINYQGSMATFYYSRQAVGIFKGTDGNVYGIPGNRNYSFDTDFTKPSLLPPLTPMFRDLDIVGFSQQLQPGK